MLFMIFIKFNIFFWDFWNIANGVYSIPLPFKEKSAKIPTCIDFQFHFTFQTLDILS